MNSSPTTLRRPDDTGNLPIIPSDRSEPHDVSADRPRGRRLRRVAIALVVLLLVAAVGPRITTWSIARGDIAHRASDIPKLGDGEHRAALVLGAGLKGDDPSPLLDDRIRAAVELLEQDRVDVLIMSGDNTTEFYDEPTAMRTRAIELGASPKQVAPDYAGRRTWDSCVRAHEVFGLDEAVVVTSAFHVDRTVVTCNAAGVDATGFSVPDARFAFDNRATWRIRELAASGRALVDAWWLQPEPAVGGDSIDPFDPCAIERSLAPSDAERDKSIAGTACTG